VDSIHYAIYDVEGVIGERKKWIHYFNDMACVIYAVPLTSYDQYTFEDDRINQMTENLLQFGDVVNSRWLRDASIIIVMTKYDLFFEKIKKWNPN
jgi:GTPase SAR1 family protein